MAICKVFSSTTVTGGRVSPVSAARFDLPRRFFTGTGSIVSPVSARFPFLAVRKSFGLTLKSSTRTSLKIYASSSEPNNMSAAEDRVSDYMVLEYGGAKKKLVGRKLRIIISLCIFMAICFIYRDSPKFLLMPFGIFLWVCFSILRGDQDELRRGDDGKIVLPAKLRYLIFEASGEEGIKLINTTEEEG